MSNIVVAINALQLLIELSVQSQKVAQMIQNAQIQGRDVTEEELNQLKLESQSAVNRLSKAVS